MILLKIGAALVLATAQWVELHAKKASKELQPVAEGGVDRLKWLAVNTEAWVIDALDAAGDKVSAIVWDRRP